MAMVLFTHLVDLPDPRTPINIRHNLMDVVFLTFAAVLSGASGWKAIE
ncbi:transposase family protein, partial [Chitinivorax sp. B]